MPSKVLHVLPIDLPRGAQRYARGLRQTLNGPAVAHRTLSIFESSSRALDADFKLDIRRTPLSRLGIEPLALLALRRALAIERPDAIVAHGSQPLKYLLPLVPRHVPLVYYKIGVATDAIRSGPRRWLHAATLRRPDRIAGVSQECLDEAEQLYRVPRHKLVLIANGRDPEVFQPRPRPNTETIPRLIFVGHFVPTKRPDWFLDVVRRLRAGGVRVEATMVGDGPLLQQLRAAAPPDVQMLGHRDDIPTLLREHDVLAFTSEPSGEGMPGVFIEAGLSGIPVVSTEVAGARTVIADGETGYVVPHDDPAAFLARTTRLLSEPALRRAMGEAARRRCLAHFTLADSTERWRLLLEELMTARHTL